MIEELPEELSHLWNEYNNAYSLYSRVADCSDAVTQHNSITGMRQRISERAERMRLAEDESEAQKVTEHESKVQKKMQEILAAADRAAKEAADRAAKEAALNLEHALISEAVKRIVSEETDRVSKAGSLALALFNKMNTKRLWMYSETPARINYVRERANYAIKSTREAQLKLDSEAAAATEAAKIAAAAATEAAKIAAAAFAKRQAMVAEERAAAKKAYEEAMSAGPSGFFANLKEVTIHAVMREGSPPLWTQGTYYCLPTGHAWRKFSDYDRREQHPEGMVYVGLYKSTLTEAWSNVHSTGIYISGSIDERAPHPRN